MLLGYARISTSKQDLTRQLDALAAVGVEPEHTYVDRKSGATTDRDGLQRLLSYARRGDVIVVHTLDRLGRTVRDTLNMLHDLNERGIGLRNLADPIRVDTTDPDDPMAQLAVVMLALFAQMERTYMLERVSHARAVAESAGKQVGRPRTVTDEQLRYAAHLRDVEHLTIRQVSARTGIPRTTLYRHLPSRPELDAGAVLADTSGR
ncbi:resolvase [Cellulomonas hominis]|uniref:DNA invertase Pin-like site-specific DNA recombinase n=1 Tax=Cellulomonas hominis TaxID=156981 RepID=A0A511FBH8_9CELL|nr:recombinase family protein [Cellulomonas hominis]MBB5474577.1 DNA invertase Pin-like site-specific DNA recombinase [Cellulomonas hominis]NKY05587.1 recombinase family protein [Cellulomonas hominis]GEL46616.1 resolvase [Cellulomonas hominis]